MKSSCTMSPYVFISCLTILCVALVEAPSKNTNTARYTPSRRGWPQVSLEVEDLDYYRSKQVTRSTSFIVMILFYVLCNFLSNPTPRPSLVYIKNVSIGNRLFNVQTIREIKIENEEKEKLSG